MNIGKRLKLSLIIVLMLICSSIMLYKPLTRTAKLLMLEYTFRYKEHEDIFRQVMGIPDDEITRKEIMNFMYLTEALNRKSIYYGEYIRNVCYKDELFTYIEKDALEYWKNYYKTGELIKDEEDISLKLYIYCKSNDIKPLLTINDLEEAFNTMERLPQDEYIGAFSGWAIYPYFEINVVYKFTRKYREYKEMLIKNGIEELPDLVELPLEQVIEFDTTGKIQEFEDMLA